MKNLFFLTVFTFNFWCVNAQEKPKERPIEERLLMKDPDEVLKQNLGNKGIAMLNRTNYLVMDNILFGVRHRWYIGDKLRLKVKGKEGKFASTLYSINDSSLIFNQYNDIMLRYEVDTVKIKDIKAIYVRRNVPFLTALSKLLPAYLVISLLGKSVKAIQTKSIYPYQDLATIEYVAYAGGIAGFFLSRQKFRITKNKPLKIFKPI
jgi:hypothetical protein